MPGFTVLKMLNITLFLLPCRDTGQKCPVDNEVLLEEQLFADNFAKREILSLTIRCPNVGCSDKMELRQLEVNLWFPDHVSMTWLWNCMWFNISMESIDFTYQSNERITDLTRYKPSRSRAGWVQATQCDRLWSMRHISVVGESLKCKFIKPGDDVLPMGVISYADMSPHKKHVRTRYTSAASLNTDWQYNAE